MKIFIVGSGTMGTGIAQVLATSSSVEDLTIFSRSEEKGSKLIEACHRNLKKLSRKGAISETVAENGFSKTRLTTTLEPPKNTDLIIEVVSESFSVKSSVLTSIADYVTPDMIVASNTSSLSITALGALLPYPEKIIGLHFFNPAPMMELVEVVKGYKTEEEVVKKIADFAESLGKSPVHVQESPGFIVNRMLMPMINEAVSVLSEGVASVQDIDKALKLGANHPMGPLKLADLIGNDVVLSIMETLYIETGDSKYRAHPLLRKMVRANSLGRKTKSGFYEY